MAFGIGSGWNVYVTVSHGVAGFVIVLLVPWKSAIAQRGLDRERPGRTASVALATLVVAALLFGVLHSTGVARSFGGVTAMQLHVGAALLSLPLVLWHIAARPARLRRVDLTRRHLIRSGAIAAAGTLVLAVSRGIERVARLPGSRRRFTGSYEQGTGDPDQMPVTQWLDDEIPSIDTADWTLTVSGRSWTYEELTAFEETTEALIDCTGGWFATQRWEGVWLQELLGDVTGARSVVVRSITGYARAFPLEDASLLLLAHSVAGERLSPGHGYPLRVVAPGRRGFWWVKWVNEIELSVRPWWLQSPFPLT